MQITYYVSLNSQQEQGFDCQCVHQVETPAFAPNIRNWKCSGHWISSVWPPESDAKRFWVFSLQNIFLNIRLAWWTQEDKPKAGVKCSVVGAYWFSQGICAVLRRERASPKTYLCKAYAPDICSFTSTPETNGIGWSTHRSSDCQ